MATTIALAVPIRDVVHYHSPENRQLTGLAKALHDHGMYLGLDVVVNHLATSALPTPFIACTAFNQGQKLTLAAPSRATTRCAPHKRRRACTERPPTHSPTSSSALLAMRMLRSRTSTRRPGLGHRHELVGQDHCQVQHQWCEERHPEAHHVPRAFLRAACFQLDCAVCKEWLWPAFTQIAGVWSVGDMLKMA